MKLQEIIRENMGKHIQDGFKAKTIKMPSSMKQYLESVMVNDFALTKDIESDTKRIFGMEIVVDNTLPPHEFRIIAAR